MRLIGWPLLIISIVLFFIDFLTFGNLNFTTNPMLQRIGQIVGIILGLSILINLIVVIAKLIKRIRRHSQEGWEKKSPSQKRAFRTKRLIGFLVLLWLLVIFPIIVINQTGSFSKVYESSQASLGGAILFLAIVTFTTLIPGFYLFPPIFICVLPLSILSIYFIFSGNWHKWRDTIFIFIIIFLVILQFKGLASLSKPESPLEDFGGENNLIVSILDKNGNKVDSEACVSPLGNLSQAKCQNTASDGKVYFMLKAGHYWLGLSFRAKDEYPKTKNVELDIQEGQTFATELVVEK